MLVFLDWLFHFLHVAVIVINTTFWLSPKTLRVAQVCLVLTLISWLGFGFFYGLGYCLLTDWHWQVKESLGQRDLPYSYIKYALDRMTGRDWDPGFVDLMTGLVTVVSVVGCAIQSYRFRSRARPGHLA